MAIGGINQARDIGAAVLAVAIHGQHPARAQALRVAKAITQRCALAHAGIDDDAVERAELAGERAKDFEYLRMVVHIECAQRHRDAGMRSQQFSLEFLKSIGASRA